MDLTIQPPYVRTLSVYRIFDIVFDNIFKHSKASHVQVRVAEVNGKLDIMIKDNGIGIPDNYDNKSSWYSGIKRIRELVYLLDGQVMLTKDNGTTVKITMDIS